METCSDVARRHRSRRILTEWADEEEDVVRQSVSQLVRSECWRPNGD